MTLPLLTEEQEQVALVHYLDIRGLKYTAIPNSTFSKHWSVKTRNTRMGVRKGFPDLIVILPGLLLCVELKRLKGGTVSLEQREWIDALNDIGPNVHAAVCKGASEAIALVESHLGKRPASKETF